MNIRRLVVPLFCCVGFLCMVLAAPADAGGDHDDDGDQRGGKGKKITVMTRNLYVGGDVQGAIGAVVSGNPVAILTEVGILFAKMQATDFPTRARALAEEVQDAKPHLIGLQEAVLWRVGPGLDPAPATTVAYDFVQILVDALRARGMRYDVACVYEGFDAEFPGFTPTGIQDIRLSDREVILVRRDGEVDVSSAQTGQFANNLMLPTPMGPFNLKRGWASVDAEVAGRMFRFVTSHLDADVPAIRLLQAGELLAGPCATSMPLVLVGDVNSDANGGPTSAAYAALQAGGFDDAWTETQGGSLGFTWGHDEMLVSPVPFTAPGGPVRIDVVLFRGDVEAHDAERHGHLPSDRFQGLWPSDHVGVSAELRIRR